MFEQAIRDKRVEGETTVEDLLERSQSPDHDILILRDLESEPHRAALLRLPVVTGQNTSVGAVGDYIEPGEQQNVRDPGVRKVMAVAREDMFHEDGGPLFCTLPVKPEPGTMFLFCYFANPKGLLPPAGPRKGEASSAPPSLLVAQNDGELRLYESVGRIDEKQAQDCRRVMDDGFVVGTVPRSALGASDATSTSPTALVNLGALSIEPQPPPTRVPDVIIVTPHDDDNGRPKVFYFASNGEGLEAPQPLHAPPWESTYQRVLRFAIQGRSQNQSLGPVLGVLKLEIDPASGLREALVIVARNIEYRNEWIQAEWAGAAPKLGGPIPPGIRSLVVATEGGGLHKYSPRSSPLTPGLYTDVWNQLRNGCVLGTVLKERVGASELTGLGGSSRIPLVNLSSLDPQAQTWVPDSAVLK